MELWMSIVGISMSLGGVVQIYRIRQRKTSDDISMTVWVVMLHGLVWWLAYGVMKGSTSLIVTNIVGIAVDSIVLTMIMKYRTSKKQQL